MDYIKKSTWEFEDISDEMMVYVECRPECDDQYSKIQIIVDSDLCFTYSEEC